MIGIEDVVLPNEQEEGSEEDDDGLFAGGDEDEEGMEEVVPGAPAAANGEGAENGVKRKLVEDDDYDYAPDEDPVEQTMGSGQFD